MTDYIIHGQTLTDTANAIRSKTGGSALIDPSDFATEISNIPSGGSVYTPTNIKFQKNFNEPDIFEMVHDKLQPIYTDWVYLESAGSIVVPPLPNDNLYSKVVVSDVSNPTDTNISNATIFYCFSDDLYARTRGSYEDDITYGSANQKIAPTKIYSYDPTGTFEWTEITVVQADWESGVYQNKISKTIYSTRDIERNTVHSIVYLILKNIIGETGKISDPYKTDYYDIYYCELGTQLNALNVVTQKAIVVFVGNMTLLSLYSLLTGGSFPPNNSENVNIMRYQETDEENPVEEETIEEQTDEVIEQNNESVENASELDA